MLLEKGQAAAPFTDADSMALVYAEDGHAYLSTGTTLYNSELSAVSVADISNVIFITNLEETWYPILEAGNALTTALDLTKHLITAVQGDSPVVSIPANLEALLENVVHLTPISDVSSDAMNYLLTVTSGLGQNVLFSNHDTLVSFAERYGAAAASSQVSALSMNALTVTMFHASTLSPIADHLSTLVGSLAFTTEFRSHVSSGMDLWSAVYDLNNIDRGWRQDVGSCISMSQYTSAALELAGHQWTQITSWVHRNVYDATTGAIYNNGAYFAADGNIYLEETIAPSNGLVGVQTSDGWRLLNIYYENGTTFDYVIERGTSDFAYEDAIEELEYLYSVSTDKPYFAVYETDSSYFDGTYDDSDYLKLDWDDGLDLLDTANLGDGTLKRTTVTVPTL
ncbi:hypothetical protein [uncultured Desulfuromonas sp.]|uniref:hypothetical protein n=1 Tax=uncultured Desulfuromonas sp. TaxID=181013 RepID=UPI002AABACF8|nr:hypothetical protein [uncultured Desulfuromonas sp.]